MNPTPFYANPYERYLHCLVKFGVNLQPGQDLLIMANEGASHSVEALVKIAKDSGAGQVEILYYQDFMESSPEALTQQAKTGWAFLKLNIFERFVSNPDQVELMERFTPYLSAISAFSRHGLIQSSSSVIPSNSWASVVFPDLPTEDAFDSLKNKLIQATYCDQPDYLERNTSHYQRIRQRCETLNKANIQHLQLKSPTCDLTVALNPDHIWVGGPQMALGVPYLPNFPTQEVFTANAKYGLNGSFEITRPFRFQDQLILDLRITIKDGQIKELSSKDNIEALIEHLHAQDDRLYFGEIAVVERDNPLARLDTVFSCVLLDENVVSHIAIGNAYPVNSKNYELALMNDTVNHSDLHIDLMIGSEAMTIEAFDGRQWFKVV